jgi:RHS repeat-associated protein
MKPIKSLIIGAFLALFCNIASAQEDNPYGVGVFTGEVTTGCDYDPYTGNARRTITDIALPSVSYPLEFGRTMVSKSTDRAYPPGTFSDQVNYPYVWTFSYRWRIVSFDCYSSGGGSTCDGSGHPRHYLVQYPDGSQVNFGASNNPPGDPYWRGDSGTGRGVRERLQIVFNSGTPVTGTAYLHLTDGGQVVFTFKKHGNGGTGVTTYDYTLSQIIDPFGRITTVTMQPDGSERITEPGGRWLQIYYALPCDPTTSQCSGSPQGNANDWVITKVTASDGRTVYYTWSAFVTTSNTVYASLTSVNYSWDSNLTATYTYTGNNAGPYFPVLSTAIDPLYTGPMWRIAYTYNGGAGQIKSENYFDGATVGAAVTSLSGAYPTWTETRADGKTRTFTYNTYAELINYSDFLSQTAAIGYGISGYTNGALGIPTKIFDFKNNETDITLNQWSTIPTQTTYPATPEDAPAGRGTVKRSYVATCSQDPNNCDTRNPYYLFSSTDEAGNTTYYYRDSKHRVTSISYPGGGSESFTYTAQFGQIQTHTLKTGDTITYQYDSRGLLQLWYDQEDSAAAPNVKYGYDSLDRVNAVTDALNNTANCTYTSRNQVNVVTLPIDPIDGVRHTLTNNYNPVDGTLASVVDQLNRQTSVTYDNYRRIKTITTPGHNTPETTSVFYGSTDSGDDYTHTDSKPTFIKSPMGKETKIVYDDNRRKLSVTVAYGTSDAATTSYTYDANGNVTSVVSPNEQPGQLYAGQSTSTTYDERNRPYLTTDALGKPTTTAFDAGGRKASNTRANGQVTTFDSYDPMNRVLQQTVKQTPDPDAVSKYTYYPSGLLHTFQDPHLVALGSTDSYSYFYDTLGRKQSLTYPKAIPSATPTVESWHYDTAGRNDTFTNRKGIVATASYDNLYRLTGVSWNDGMTPSFTNQYDVSNRPVSVTNAYATIAWTYFNDGLLNTETTTSLDNLPRTVTYTYDNDGNVSTLLYPIGDDTSVTYTYTNRDQLLSLSTSGSTGLTTATYGYDPNGNVLTRALNNSTSSSYTYDGLNRVTHVGHTLNGTTRTFDYGYDSVGNQKWVKRDGGNGDVFGYDLAGQSTSILLNVANPDTTSPGPQTVFYDAGGNRTLFQAEGLNDNYETNPLNQYTTRGSSSASYDPAGNMTAGFDGSVYTFDALNRCLTASKGSTIDNFLYDGLGRQTRSSTTDGTGAPNYHIYDGWSLIDECFVSRTTSWFMTSIRGASELVRNLGNTMYYYQDGRGSTSHVADSTGVLDEYYRYDLQGAPTFYNAGGTQITASAYGIRDLFNGERWLSDVSLYDLRHRFYSPNLGRFIQADPSGHDGGDNLYRYCSNNPMNSTDPMGLSDLGFYDYFSELNGMEINGGFDYSYVIPGTDVTVSDISEHSATLSIGQPPPLANQVPQQFQSGGAIGNNWTGYYFQGPGTSGTTFQPTAMSSSPLQSNFGTGLPVFSSPITGTTIELPRGLPQIKGSLINEYHDLRYHPIKIAEILASTMGPGELKGAAAVGRAAWADWIMQFGGDRMVLGREAGGEVLEYWGVIDEARFEFGTAGHVAFRDAEQVEQAILKGEHGFTMNYAGTVMPSSNLAKFKDVETLKSLQAWVDSVCFDAPRLRVRQRQYSF